MDNNFYLIIKHLHSELRWFLLGMLLLTIIISLSYIFQNKGLTKKGQLAARITLISAHLQLLAGALIYLISPKVIFSASSMQSPILRFYLVEHISVMIISVSLITIGYIRMKKNVNIRSSSRNIFWYYITALILMLIAMPWPFMHYGGTWF